MPIVLPLINYPVIPDGWEVLPGEALNPERRGREGLEVIAGEKDMGKSTIAPNQVRLNQDRMSPVLYAQLRNLQAKARSILSTGAGWPLTYDKWRSDASSLFSNVGLPYPSNAYDLKSEFTEAKRLLSSLLSREDTLSGKTARRSSKVKAKK